MAEVWEVWSKRWIFCAPPHRAYGPIAVIFEDVPLRKNDPSAVPVMKAWRLDRNGARRPATSSDISDVVGSKIGRSFYCTGDERGILISKTRFLIWLLGGEWDYGGFGDLALFQLDYLLPAVPPTPEYFRRVWARMNHLSGGRFGVPGEEPDGE